MLYKIDQSQLRSSLHAIYQKMVRRYADINKTAETGYFAESRYQAKTRYLNGHAYHSSEESVATVAYRNNFGFYSNYIKRFVPARPFFTDSKNDFFENIKKYHFTYSNFNQLFPEFIGSFSQDIKNNINSSKYEPNSPLTIALKGSSQPLIDESIMSNSIKYKIS